jgi:hypothetical protein
VRIDPRIEPLVREAFAAAVAQESDRFNSAISTISEKSDESFKVALNLALDVCRVALFTIHEGQRPDNDQLAYIAGGFDNSEAWVGLSPGDSLTFLTALADMKSVTDALPLTTLIPMVFAMGGWLLSAFLPENKHWYNFLDEILREIEVSPERS